MTLLLFTVLYTLSALLSRLGLDLLSSSVMIAAGIWCYFSGVSRYHDLLAPPAVFSLSWISCIGISLLRLSYLQKNWTGETFLVFWLIYIFFAVSFDLTGRFLPAVFSGSGRDLRLFCFSLNEKQLRILILSISAVSVSAFLIEAAALGYIPLFTSNTPHAYSYFHISGLHYFTVSFVLIPSLAVFYFHSFRKSGRFVAVGICFLISLMLPLLLVSRFQLIFSVILAFLTFLLVNRSRLRSFLNLKNCIIFVLSLTVMVLAYVFITVERAHSVEYLNGIFEIKNPDLPIFVTQPYIYIANNFDNFNCLVEEHASHSWGLKSLFPLFALSGLKFLFPGLVSFPLYVTKEELTTVTMFYDSYYDFGIPGCCLFAALLGFVYSCFFHSVRDDSNQLILLIYAQLLVYLLLAFFTAWFSNPTVWFYFGICVVSLFILWYINKVRNRSASCVSLNSSVLSKGNRNER